MPFTFFAHQVPVLPIARRWPQRTDGVALVIGSMAPDMAYVLNGSRFSVWAHGFPEVVLFCLPVTVVVSWLITRVMSPVLWDHLPQLGPFRLKDYRALSSHRLSWSLTPVCALIGALSHAAIDQFTHLDGWAARNVGWYRAVIIDDLLGRTWTAFRIAQYAGHVVGTAVALWLLASYGRRRWMATRAETVEPYPVTASSTAILGGAVIAGVTGGSVWVLSDSAGSASDIIRVAACCFVSLVASTGLLQWARQR